MEVINGYQICESKRHGKAVKGTKRTSSFQVRKPLPEGYLLLFQKSFPVSDYVKKQRAFNAAKEFAKKQPPTATER
jgi:hypothetical protein